MTNLYVVATPIGHLGDLSPRAREVLASVDWVAAEDTRHSKILLKHFGISTPLIALHQHNEAQQTTQLITRMVDGQRGALISDAGTPLISDPGRRLVQETHRAGLKVSPIPGPCALIAALSASGFPADQFVFLGFLPAQANMRREQIKTYQDASMPVVLYEAPHRIIACIEDWMEIVGAERPAVLARELTKTFETIVHGTLSELLNYLNEHADHCRGEMVLMIAPQPRTLEERLQQTILDALNIALKELSPSQAIRLISQLYGVRKNQVYDWAQALKIEGQAPST